MKLYFFILIISFCSFNLSAQRALFSKPYEALAQDFGLSNDQLEKYRAQGKLTIFNTEKHKTNLAVKLLNSRVGKTRKIDGGYYKKTFQVLAKKDITHYRIRYVFINKTKFKTQEELDNYKSKVRKLLKNTDFKSVAMQYSMDYKKNVGGDSGWFKKGKTFQPFFEEVTSTNRLAEEIFEFEIETYNAYYFVQKTHAKTDIKEVLVLEIKEDL